MIRRARLAAWLAAIAAVRLPFVLFAATLAGFIAVEDQLLARPLIRRALGLHSPSLAVFGQCGCRRYCRGAR